MGMSTHVVGIKPSDAKWKRMKEAYDACEAAGVVPPAAVLDFFGVEEPDEKGVVVELEETDCVQEYHDDRGTSAGFEVDVTKLPDDVKIVRFFNSW